MIKRIKRIWHSGDNTEDIKKTKKQKPNAVFFDEGSQEEHVEQERKDNGMSGWYKRLRNL